MNSIREVEHGTMFCDLASPVCGAHLNEELRKGRLAAQTWLVFFEGWKDELKSDEVTLVSKFLLGSINIYSTTMQEILPYPA